ATEMLQLWQHSLGVSLASGVIARRIGLKDAEEVIVAGLLHDIGKVVLNVEGPEYFEQVTQKTAEGKLLFIEAEQEILGFDHTLVGEWLCDKWNLPANLRDPITLHHTPAVAKNASEATAVVHVADVIVRALEFGSGGDSGIPVLNREAVVTLNISISDLEEILDEMEHELIKAEDLIPSE
ncbi:MAG: HDOD domain-containing protein, partial [bacterium]